jgi:hypothetical protein
MAIITYNSEAELQAALTAGDIKAGPIVARGGKFTVIESSEFFVRPSGGSYGDEDGTSYANAWDGFTNIDWDAVSGGTLYVCGTHTETLTLGADNVTIRGDYAGDAGVIDGEDTRDYGILVTSKDNVTITSLTAIDALDSCMKFDGTSSGIIINSCTVSGSGNQGFQNYDTAQVVYNNCTSQDNFDDGYSGHVAANVVINGGTVSGNGSGINYIEDCTFVVNDVTFSGNTLDFQVRNNATLEANNCVVPGDSRLEHDTISVLNNCIIGNIRTGTASGHTAQATFNNCSIDFLWVTYSTTAIANQCLISSWDDSGFSTANLNDSVIVGDMESSGTVVVKRCLFIGGTDFHVDVLSGADYYEEYSIHYDMNAVDYGVAVRAGATAEINNSTFVGTVGPNVGRGIYSLVDITVSNCIFTGLEVAVQQAGGTFVLNNCVFYNNNTDINGTVTQNNSQTGDPLLADPANFDFSLGIGSSAIGNGATLTEATGIASADWGNGTDETPTVTTKEQGASWDIGAYIS